MFYTSYDKVSVYNELCKGNCLPLQSRLHSRQSGAGLTVNGYRGIPANDTPEII